LIDNPVGPTFPWCGWSGANVSSDNMEGLHFTFPNPDRQEDLANYVVPEPMAYMAACYYRYFRDPEFVRSMMAWCKEHLQDTHGRDIEDRLTSSDSASFDDDDDDDNGTNGTNGTNGIDFGMTERTRH
jgi:hypothetical protein